MPRDIFLYEPIVPGTAQRIMEETKAAGGDEIHLRINSPGGSAHEGFAIFNHLKSIPNKVVTHNDGIAASAASWALMAGSERNGAEASQVMIHNTRGGMASMTAEDMRKAAPVMDAIDDLSAKIVSQASGMKIAKVRKLMSEETFFSSAQSKKLGLIHNVTNRLKAVALLTKEDMNLLDEIKAAAKNLGFTSQSDKEDGENVVELAKAQAVLTEEAAAKQQDTKDAGAEGADILLKDMVKSKDFLTFSEAITSHFVPKVMEYIESQPTEEEINARIDSKVDEALNNLLTKMKSEAEVVTPTNNFQNVSDEVEKEAEHVKSWKSLEDFKEKVQENAKNKK